MSDRPLSNLTADVLRPVWDRTDIPTARIAARLGVTPTGLRLAARRLGLPPRPRRAKIDADLFARMWMAGVRCRDIAAVAGYRHPGAVAMRRRALGLPPRIRTRSGQPGTAPRAAMTLARFRELEQARALHAQGRGT